MADIPDAAGNFGADSAEAAKSLQANGFNVTAVNLADVPVAQARKAIIDTLNSPAGVRLFNYVGHGGVDVLSNSAVLANADASLLVNGAHLPVFLAFTCAAGDGTYPGYDSLAETLLWRTGGGAIAAVAPTGLSDNGQAHLLNMSLVGALRNTGARVRAPRWVRPPPLLCPSSPARARSATCWTSTRLRAILPFACSSERRRRCVAQPPAGNTEQNPLADNEPDAPSALPEPSKSDAQQIRKAYERPRILSREPLEVMAATCTRPFGKATGVCSTGRS